MSNELRCARESRCGQLVTIYSQSHGGRPQFKARVISVSETKQIGNQRVLVKRGASRFSLGGGTRVKSGG